MKTSHQGQTALITGASSGIGLELARVFAEEGFNLILVSRQRDTLEQLGRELNQSHHVQVIAIEKDLFQPAAAEELYAELKNRGQRVDVLVNNAGQGESGKVYEIDLHRQLDIIQLNVSSLVALTHLFLQDMVERNEGKILNLGSVASMMPHPRMAVYAATKAFVLSFSEALRHELKDTNITVTTLMPGPTETDFFNKAHLQDTNVGQMKKADPATVAEAGYKALMDGDDKIIQGLMNKLQVTTSNVMPEEWVTALAGMYTKPRGDEEQQPGHSGSSRQR